MSEPGEEGEAAAQPTQPVFRSELAGASRLLVSPDSFSGLSNWAEWIDHFEAAALVNGWDSEKKRLWLPVRLTGKAQTAWKRLSPETKQNYEAAKEALQKRFEPDSKRKLYFVEFQARRRKRDESWSDFADELRVLAEKALPELDQKAKELLALEIYLGELDYPQVAFAVRQREPKTIDEAVTATLEIQSYLRPGVRQEVNAATVAEEVGAQSIAATLSTSSGQDTVLEILKILSARLERLESSLGDAAATRRPMRTTGTGVEGRAFVRNKTVQCMIDTGATVSLFKKTVWCQLEGEHSCSLSPWDGHKLVGVEEAVIHKGTNVATAIPFDEMMVAPVREDSNVPAEFEVSSCKRGLLHDMADRSADDLTSEEKNRLYELLVEFADVFAESSDDMGRTGVKHSIDTGTSHPIRQQCRRVPPFRREQAKKMIDDMLQKDIIQPSSSPWASPIILVPKKDGSLRFCIDYRKLNSVTRKDAYPLPRVDDTLEALSGSKWFSTLDLLCGYWQVEVEEKDRHKTAFCTREGLFEFKVMPFGLCNAPAVFQRLMDLVLSGIQWERCLVYIDDIVIMGKTFERHLQNLKLVLERLRRAGLKLKPSKCSLFQDKVVYLGHVVTRDGIHTDPEKVNAVSKWPVPTSGRDVQQFLGLVGYYRNYIQSFATIAKPLYQLTERGREFDWSKECSISFQELRSRLVAAPILAFPDFSKTFLLDTDACETGIGAVLSQEHDGLERVVAYASRTLNKSECPPKIKPPSQFSCSDGAKACTVQASKEPLSNIRELQGADEDVGPILQSVISRKVPDTSFCKGKTREFNQLVQQWEQLLFKNGILYRYHEDEGNSNVQVVVPKAARCQILKQLHEGAFGGHLGEAKTLNRLRERFYWPGYSEDAVEWCKTCPTCAARKNPSRKSRAPLQSVTAGYPLQLVAVDIVGPLTPSKTENTYILVASDYFTRWVEAYAIPNQEAVTVANKLVDEFFCKFSVPEQLHSDQGRQFEANVMQEVCRLLQIDKTRTTPYHPQSDGLVERFNRTMLAMLASTVEEDPSNWEQHLRKVCMAYNTSVQPSTGYTPFYLMFGRLARLPVDIMYGSCPTEPVLPHQIQDKRPGSRKRVVVHFDRLKPCPADIRMKPVVEDLHNSDANEQPVQFPGSDLQFFEDDDHDVMVNSTETNVTRKADQPGTLQEPAVDTPTEQTPATDGQTNTAPGDAGLLNSTPSGINSDGTVSQSETVTTKSPMSRPQKRIRQSPPAQDRYPKRTRHAPSRYGWYSGW
eukprot:Em0011g456a